MKQLIKVLKDRLNSFLKKYIIIMVYGYSNLIMILYMTLVTIWIGSFSEREDGKNLHSISKKLRKELIKNY